MKHTENQRTWLTRIHLERVQPLYNCRCSLRRHQMTTRDDSDGNTWSPNTHIHNCSPLLVALSSQPGFANKSDKWSSAHAHTPWQPRRISTDIHSAKVSLQRLVALSITGFSYLFFCIAHCLRICYCKSSLKLSLQKTGEQMLVTSSV